MTRKAALACAIAALCGCAGVGPARRTGPPAPGEGDLLVYLQPPPASMGSRVLPVLSVAAVSTDGTEWPMDLRLPEIGEAGIASQRLLASARIPAGSYVALTLRTGVDGPGAGGVATGAGQTHRLELPFTVGSPVPVVRLRLAAAPPGSPPSFSAELAVRPPPDLVGLVSVGEADLLAAFDAHTREVAAAFPAGRGPGGVAIDAAHARAYVALAEQDEVEILDLAAGQWLGGIRLRAGDGPRELALTRDGRRLLVVNAGSSSVSFLDVATRLEVTRVATGLGPVSIALDPLGQRAYVACTRASVVTVIDVPNAAVVQTLTTDSEPIQAILDRNGTRLVVLHAVLPYLTFFGVPDGRPAGRAFVGVGAAWVEADPRSGFLYVARRDQGSIQVYEPLSLLPVAVIEIPGPASRLAFDLREGRLLAVIPSRRAVGVVALTERRLLSVIDVPEAPFAAVTTGGAR